MEFIITSPSLNKSYEIYIINTKVMKYEINEETLKAIEAFLGRVDLKGSEVNAFNAIIKALSTPIEEKKEVIENGKDTKTK